MANKNSVSNFVDSFADKAKFLSGKVVGKDFQLSKLRMAKDEKGAMVNDIVDKYLKKDLTNEYLEPIREEYGIIIRDIMKEIAKREIEKVFRV